MVANNSAMPETALRHDCTGECAYRMYIKHEQRTTRRQNRCGFIVNSRFMLALLAGRPFLAFLSFIANDRCGYRKNVYSPP